MRLTNQQISKLSPVEFQQYREQLQKEEDAKLDSCMHCRRKRAELKRLEAERITLYNETIARSSNHSQH